MSHYTTQVLPSSSKSSNSSSRKRSSSSKSSSRRLSCLDTLSPWLCPVQPPAIKLILFYLFQHIKKLWSPSPDRIVWLYKRWQPLYEEIQRTCSASTRWIHSWNSFWSRKGRFFRSQHSKHDPIRWSHVDIGQRLQNKWFVYGRESP